MVQPEPVGPRYYGRRYVLDRQAGEWFIWDQTAPGSIVFRAPDTPEGWREASKRFDRLEPSPGVRAALVVGIVVVSVWMAISLVYSWLILGLATNPTCESRPNPGTCFDTYGMWWASLLGLHFVTTVAAVVLWIFPRTRAVGLAVGFLGTGVAAIVFTAAFGVDL